MIISGIFTGCWRMQYARISPMDKRTEPHGRDRVRDGEVDGDLDYPEIPQNVQETARYLEIQYTDRHLAFVHPVFVASCVSIPRMRDSADHASSAPYYLLSIRTLHPSYWVQAFIYARPRHLRHRETHAIPSVPTVAAALAQAAYVRTLRCLTALRFTAA